MVKINRKPKGNGSVTTVTFNGKGFKRKTVKVSDLTEEEIADTAQKLSRYTIWKSYVWSSKDGQDGSGEVYYNPRFAILDPESGPELEERLDAMFGGEDA